MTYRPICDIWLLARPKVKYYGAYPNGFLERARVMIGCSYYDKVLHVCSGKVNQYPNKGFGINEFKELMRLAEQIAEIDHFNSILTK